MEMPSWDEEEEVVDVGLAVMSRGGIGGPVSPTDY
jgi:hypothetical protein